MPDQNSKPRILWITRNCLLDQSSGAAISARQILKQLASRGCEVRCLSATIFDAESGREKFNEYMKNLDHPPRYLEVRDGAITHEIIFTANYQKEAMRFDELGALFGKFEKTLKEFKPDVVWLYGGKFFDRMIANRAKAHGALTAFYLVNGNYTGHAWYQDIDLVTTDSNATSDLYKKRLNIDVKPIGRFIQKNEYLADRRDPKYVTFVNPSPAKGGLVVAQIALEMDKRRPDILFEVVESRGKWTDALRAVSKALGEERSELDNVLVTPTTQDMRPIYGRSRVVLMPSLWWESGGRVVSEAAINGIPSIVTNRGGPVEAIGRGGIKLNLPEEMFERPFRKLLPKSGIDSIIKGIERIFDDEDFYNQLVAEITAHAQKTLSIEKNTDRLLSVLLDALESQEASSS